MCLLYDNAPRHTTVISTSVTREGGFSELDHPPQSSRRTPSDYLVSKLRGRRFDSHEVQPADLEDFSDKEELYFFPA